MKEASRLTLKDVSQTTRGWISMAAEITDMKEEDIVTPTELGFKNMVFKLMNEMTTDEVRNVCQEIVDRGVEKDLRQLKQLA